MKRLLIVFVSLLVIMMGCGMNDTGNTSENITEDPAAGQNVDANSTNGVAETAVTPSEESHSHELDGTAPHEPGEGVTCSMCDMMVYHKEEEMGRFTGQVLTADGEHLFTDDVGCLMNQIRKLDHPPLNAWVRDYNTLEWIQVTDAAAVKADIQTPMNMGFALFQSETSAQQFVEDHADLNPILSSMAEIDQIAEERFKKKMEKMMEMQTKMGSN